ncbi:MAG: hypothetical protein PWP23_297 [Candidatus Sumerlaeota bacterium]|nr:hypothetical protein [Candidatus Sumerlaeota bacterium]
MMKRPATALLATMLLGGSLLSAQNFDVVLSPEQAAELSPEGARHYSDALEKIDRADPAGALEGLAAAAATDPDNIELQFLVAKYGRARAEVTYGEDSLKYYDMAEMALRRLLGNPRLGPEERARVRRESERIRDGKEKLRARDDARLKDGFKLVLQIREDRLEATGIKQKMAEIQGIEDLLKEEDSEEEEQITREDIWIAYGAPGLAIADDTLKAQTNQNPYAQFGAFGAAAGGFGDPFSATGGGGFADPSIPGGFATDGTGGFADPSMPGGFVPGADPFSAGGGGGTGATPYGDPFSASPAPATSSSYGNPIGFK